MLHIIPEYEYTNLLGHFPTYDNLLIFPFFYHYKQCCNEHACTCLLMHIWNCYSTVEKWADFLGIAF